LYPNNQIENPYYDSSEKRVVFPNREEALGLEKTLSKLEKLSKLPQNKMIRMKGILVGLITHFVIGYTTFIHLLPAYIACAIYLFGLFASYP
jgi:hypothetical protein